MNPFDILIPGTFAIVLLVGIAALVYWRNRPSESEVRAYQFGYEDGDLEATPIRFSIPRLREAYAEGYADGERGRNRRADAELLRQRIQGETPPDTTTTKPERRPCTCGRRLRDQATQQEP